MISFIILSWNSSAFLPRCFDSIINKCNQEQLNFEIIIIDNGSQDNSSDIINAYKEKFRHIIQPILLQDNTGTTYSRNLGLAKAKGEFIALLDSDTELLEGSLQEVCATLSKSSEIGLVSPQLLLPDGSVQNSAKKFPTFIDKMLKLPGILLNIQICNLDFYKDFPFKTECNIDSAISACWFFRKNLINHVGLFDEKIFYSPEDLDYCMRTWKAGFKIVYFPTFKVFHNTQQISHQSPFSKIAFSHFKGLLYYFKKHGGWFKAYHPAEQTRSIEL